MFTRILVPTDFSAPSDAALECARTLAAKFRGTLHLLHVVEEPMVPGPLGLGPEMYIGSRVPPSDALLEDVTAQMKERVCDGDRGLFGATTDAVFGHPAHTIVSYADVNGFDSIVMGTHGRTGLAYVLMGSVAEHVVRTASCPVLTVRGAPESPRVRAVEWRSAGAAA